MTELLRWFPWRWVVSRVARARGLIDPIKVLSRLESFAQPLEVKEPLELLRAGMVFHARGLLNTSAIQHNLDWIWPYWVERQYDPEDVSFIPRAFSITHVNLTHRNWTGFGLPDVDQIPIVDPRGLVTPFWDGWSLDAWILADDGSRLVPSQVSDLGGDARVEQELLCCSESPGPPRGAGGGDGPDAERTGAMAVATRTTVDGLALTTRAEVVGRDAKPELLLTHTAATDRPAWLAVALRPYNPEGVSFVHRIALDTDRRGWLVDKMRSVRFDHPAEAHRFSTYREGDVSTRLPESGEREAVECPVGMATAAALYRLEPETPRSLQVAMPLVARADLRRWPPPFRRAGQHPTSPGVEAESWARALDGHCRLETPDERTRFLYDAAVRSVVLHAPGEDVYPGPYTYKRFWFRDAAFILHALVCLGLFDRAWRVLDTYPARQTRKGFFLSQEGEWDSNGEALWILERFCALSGRTLDSAWRHPVEKGARWIADKRVPSGDEPHAGLLPPGFSAEHLGPNDYYYWDDFWGVAGLRAAAALLEPMGEQDAAAAFRAEADDLAAAIDRSVERSAELMSRSGDAGSMPAIAASPYRRLDSGAIGSLAGSYPLALWAPDDPRMLRTADYLAAECLVDGGFFQDVIHSGINPYLTLHLAQVALRIGDVRGAERAADLMRTVARLASATGQWPEAVHPRTGGGCMGDGHHVWAAAEWILAVRNALVREEGDHLVLASGLLPEWLDGGPLVFGPAPTPWGAVTLRAELRETVGREAGGRVLEIAWEGAWRGTPPPVQVGPPSTGGVAAAGGDGSVTLPWPGVGPIAPKDEAGTAEGAETMGVP